MPGSQGDAAPTQMGVAACTGRPQTLIDGLDWILINEQSNGDLLAGLIFDPLSRSSFSISAIRTKLAKRNKFIPR